MKEAENSKYWTEIPQMGTNVVLDVLIAVRNSWISVSKKFCPYPIAHLSKGAQDTRYVFTASQQREMEHDIIVFTLCQL